MTSHASYAEKKSRLVIEMAEGKASVFSVFVFATRYYPKS